MNFLFGVSGGCVYNEQYANGCTMIVSTEVFVRLRNIYIYCSWRANMCIAGRLCGRLAIRKEKSLISGEEKETVA